MGKSQNIKTISAIGVGNVGGFSPICGSRILLNKGSDSQIYIALIVTVIPSLIMISISQYTSKWFLALFLCLYLLSIYYLFRTWLTEPGIMMKKEEEEEIIPEASDIQRKVNNLMACIRNGKVDIVTKMFVQVPTIVNEVNIEGRTVLHVAVLLNKPIMVSHILQFRPDVMKRDSYNLCPLHYAAFYNFDNICQLLFEYIGVSHRAFISEKEKYQNEVEGILPTYDVQTDTYKIYSDTSVLSLDDIKECKYQIPQKTIYATNTESEVYWAGHNRVSTPGNTFSRIIPGSTPHSRYIGKTFPSPGNRYQNVSTTWKVDSTFQTHSRSSTPDHSHVAYSISEFPASRTNKKILPSRAIQRESENMDDMPLLKESSHGDSKDVFSDSDDMVDLKKQSKYGRFGAYDEDENSSLVLTEPFIQDPSTIIIDDDDDDDIGETTSGFSSLNPVVYSPSMTTSLELTDINTTSFAINSIHTRHSLLSSVTLPDSAQTQRKWSKSTAKVSQPQLSVPSIQRSQQGVSMETNGTPSDYNRKHKTMNSIQSLETEDEMTKHSLGSSPVYKRYSYICIDKNSIVTIRRCVKCHLFMPPRSIHCKTCDCCIRGFDHHCPWMGNCIGIRNHLYFLSFLFFGLLALFMGLLLASWGIVVSVSRSFNYYHNINIGYMIIDSWPELLFFICTLFIFAPLGNLLAYHFYITSLNLTTHEEISLPPSRIRKSSHMPVSYYYPYNEGLWRNWKAFFQTKKIRSHFPCGK